MSTTDTLAAAVRAGVYGLVATGFAFPVPDRLARLRDVYVPALQSADLPGPIGATFDELVGHLPGDADLARSRHAIMFPPVASPDAPAFETAYRGEGIFQQAAILADIAGFYRAHGLRSGGTERERPDHIVVESEFMSVLARKEMWALAEGDDSKARVCRDSGVAFLRDHLGCWAGAFGRRTRAVPAGPWYRILGELLVLWIAHDMASLGITPAEVVDEPRPVPPPDDGTCGPCTVPMEGVPT